MPLGALPVKAMLAEGADAAKKRIDALLDASLPPLLTDPVFYAIGGGWRALARVHIALTGAPISVVHGYDVAAEEVRALAKKISRMTPAEVAALPDVPSRRVDTLPAAAAVMHRVLKKLQPERVVFSLLGLREGWLYAPARRRRSGTATRCSRGRWRSGCRPRGCRSSARRWRAGPTTCSPARRRATGGCGSPSAR